MDRKTLISFDLRKHVDNRCNGQYSVHRKTQKQGELQHRLHSSCFNRPFWR